jgi:hypothetical protein
MYHLQETGYRLGARIVQRIHNILHKYSLTPQIIHTMCIYDRVIWMVSDPDRGRGAESVRDEKTGTLGPP